jgi:CRISPR-associated protein (TIGR02710 family)
MNSDQAKALIMTVGLPGDQGGDVLDALELDLASLKPSRLILIASGQSVANAKRMQERSGLGTDACQIIELAAAHDLDEVFRQVNRAVRDLIDHGFSPDQIAINYTSGTKVMGSGAVLSAVYNKIRELRYITGLGAVRESDRARRRVLTTQPAAAFAYQDLLESVQMMTDLRFQSAGRMLDRIDDAFLSPEDQGLHAALSILNEAYDEWDNFYPDRFLDRYRTGDFSALLLRPFRLESGQLEAVVVLVEERGRQQPGPSIIGDLYNNAVRRLLVGRPEDAFTRIYRTLESLAQWVLLRDRGIDTNDVDTRRIPPRDRVGYEALRSLDDGMVKIGLRKAFDLLVVLDTQVGRKFKEDAVLGALLEKRSASILAHGYTPADAPMAEQFLLHAGNLFHSEIPDFVDLARRLQFPWLHRHPKA